MIRRMVFAKARTALGILHGSRAFGGPVQVDLRLTNRCNLRCIHCYYYSPFLQVPAYYPLRVARSQGVDPPSAADLKRMFQIDLSPKRIRTTVQELLEMGTQRFQLGGNGEPFLYKDAMELIAILKRAGCYCFANTNGTLIDTAAADELIKLHFDELRITMMAGAAESYVRTHPGSTPETFERLRKTLVHIAGRKTALKARRPKITLVLIVITQNSGCIFEFAKFAAEVAADLVLYRPVDDIGDPGLANLVPDSGQAASIVEQLEEARRFLESRGINQNIAYFMKIFSRQLDTGMLYRIIPCYYGWLSTVIDPDGNVYPCCRCYKPLGNINERSFHDIWNGKPYCEFRREALNLHKRRRPLTDCSCYRCVHHTANLRAYRAMHPLKGRSSELHSLRPGSPDDGYGQDE